MVSRRLWISRWLEPDEAERLIECCSDRLRPLVIFLLYTGCRISEATSLTWDRVNLSEGMAYIPKTKNGQPQSLKLPERVVNALAQMKHYDNGFFGYVSAHSTLRAWHTACERAGIDNLTPHDLRHTWATWMRRYGKLDEIGLVSTGRWSSPKSVARYAHAAPSEAALAVDRLPGVQNPCSPKKTGTK